MEIRNYVSGDFDKFVSLLKECGLFYDIIHKKEILENKIVHDPESVIVAEDDNRIVGSVIVVFDPWQSFIYDVAVLPQYRKQGIGSMLMEEAEKRLRDRGAKLISLFIAEGHEYIAEFYKKRGWYIWGKCTNMEKQL